MEMIFGSLIQIHLEVKLHFTSLHKAYCFKTIQDQRLFYHDQGGNRDSNQESSKCLLALFSFKIGKSTGTSWAPPYILTAYARGISFHLNNICFRTNGFRFFLRIQAAIFEWSQDENAGFILNPGYVQYTNWWSELGMHSSHIVADLH